MLDGQQKPSFAESQYDIALGYQFDSNNVGKVGFAQLEKVMEVNDIVTIVNNVVTKKTYDDKIESDYWDR